MIQRMLAIWSLVPLPFLHPAWTSENFSVHVLLKPGLENFEHYLASMWDECNCAVVWAFFGIAFLPTISFKIWGQNYQDCSHFIGEGNGNPLLCCYLENPRDRGAWWSAVCGVTQSQTRLKQLSSSSSILFSVAKLCQTLCDPMDCSLPGSSIHGIFQARILEWVAISSSRGSSQLRDQTHVSCIGRQILYHWATWEAISPYIFVIRYNSNRKLIQRSCFSLDWSPATAKELSKQDDMITLKHLITCDTHIRC